MAPSTCFLCSTPHAAAALHPVDEVWFTFASGERCLSSRDLFDGDTPRVCATCKGERTRELATACLIAAHASGRANFRPASWHVRFADGLTWHGAVALP